MNSRKDRGFRLSGLFFVLGLGLPFLGGGASAEADAGGQWSDLKCRMLVQHLS